MPTPPPTPQLPLGESHDPQGRDLHSSGQGRYVILSLMHGWILTEALCLMEHQYPTGSHNSRNLNYGRTHQKGEGWIPLMPIIKGHLKHIFQSQPAKGSLQLNTDREATQPGKHSSEPVTKSSWEGGRGEGRSLQSPSPNPLLPLATLAPHKSLGVEMRRGLQVG